MGNIGFSRQQNPLADAGMGLMTAIGDALYPDPRVAERGARAQASQANADAMNRLRAAQQRKYEIEAAAAQEKAAREQQDYELNNRAVGAYVDAAGRRIAAPQAQPRAPQFPLSADNPAYAAPVVVQPDRVALGRYRDDVANARAEAEFLARGGGNADQRAQGLGRYAGQQILMDPNASPDQLRRGGTLYTNKLPDTNTVMGTGDFAGVDAAARQRIAEERAKPQTPIFAADHRQQIVPDPNNPGGYMARPVAGMPMGDDQFLTDYALRRQNGMPTQPQEDLRYSQLIEQKFPTTYHGVTNERGEQLQVPMRRTPEGFYDPRTQPASPGPQPYRPALPEQSRFAPPQLNVEGFTPQPQATPAAPVIVGAERGATPAQNNLPRGTINLGRGPENLNSEQQRVNTFANSMLPAARYFEGMGPAQLPSRLTQLVTAAASGSPVTWGQMLTAAGGGPEARRYLSNVLGYLGPELRLESGASVFPLEYARNWAAELPLSGDTPADLADKQSRRARKLSTLIEGLPLAARDRTREYARSIGYDTGYLAPIVMPGGGVSAPSQLPADVGQSVRIGDTTMRRVR